jgi:hypothetical protein
MDTIEVHSIDQFGLVAGMCDDIRLAERIDAVVGKDKRKVSVGTAVKAMILNAQMGIDTRFLHLDSTTFSFFGDAYQAAEQHGSEDEEEAGDMDIQPVMVTHGLSKDHRPELKQLVLQMICTNRSTLPQWIEILSGNSADSTSFPQTIQRFITRPLPVRRMRVRQRKSLPKS